MENLINTSGYVRLSDNEKVEKLEEYVRYLESRLNHDEKNLELFDSLMSAIPDGIYFKDSDSKFIKANKATIELFGISSEEELLGKSDFDFQDSTHAHQAFCDEQNIIQTGEPLINIEEKEIWDDGVRWVSSTKLPLKNSKDEIIGTFGISRDITRMKNMEAELEERNRALVRKERQLQQAVEDIREVQDAVFMQKTEIEEQKEKLIEQYNAINSIEDIVEIRTQKLRDAKDKAELEARQKSSFLANMSHEIRTPMNSIVGFSRLLATGDISKEQTEKYIRLINTSADSLMVLINDILDLSMIESDRLKFESSPFDLNNLIDEININYTLNREKKDVDFIVINNVEDEHIELVSDRSRIMQVITNIINNAFKFTQEGNVFFTVSSEDSMLQFAIKDTGIGIDPESIESVFDRYMKMSKDKSKYFKGVGLGMAISKKIAENMGGDIFVTSEPGKGSEFVFNIPVAK